MRAIHALLALLIVVGVGCATHDTWIENEIHRRIDLAENIRHYTDDVSVDSRSGAVTLTGKVTSDADSRSIELIASTTRGVKAVDNRLDVNS